MLKCLKNTVLLCALMLVHFKGQAQCTKICGTVTAISSGTGIVGTVTVAAKGNYTITTTYNYVTLAGVNSITSGALSVSVSNVGTAVAQFNGVTLPIGATVNIEIPNAVLPSYTYDCLTSALVVLVNR